MSDMPDDADVVKVLRPPVVSARLLTIASGIRDLFE